MNLLVVVAHPDDEVLGFGATGSLLTDGGHTVTACFLSGDVAARGARPEDDALRHDTLKAQKILGFQPPIFGAFPNIKMNSVPHLELVQFIEEAMVKCSADAIVTHHPHDINDDHRQVASAAMAAARLQQRNPSLVPPLRKLLQMEILSSTEWQFASHAAPFNPDTYVEIGDEYLERKLAALRAYRGVMRDYPHPRSPEAIRAQATLRGTESGLNLAEAFATGYRRWLMPQEAF